MLSRRLLHAAQPRPSFVCPLCSVHGPRRPQTRPLSASAWRPNQTDESSKAASDIGIPLQDSAKGPIKKVANKSKVQPRAPNKSTPDESSKKISKAHLKKEDTEKDSGKVKSRRGKKKEKKLEVSNEKTSDVDLKQEDTKNDSGKAKSRRAKKKGKKLEVSNEKTSDVDLKKEDAEKDSGKVKGRRETTKKKLAEPSRTISKADLKKEDREGSGKVKSRKDKKKEETPKSKRHTTRVNAQKPETQAAPKKSKYKADSTKTDAPPASSQPAGKRASNDTPEHVAIQRARARAVRRVGSVPKGLAILARQVPSKGSELVRKIPGDLDEAPKQMSLKEALMAQPIRKTESKRTRQFTSKYISQYRGNIPLRKVRGSIPLRKVVQRASIPLRKVRGGILIRQLVPSVETPQRKVEKGERRARKITSLKEALLKSTKDTTPSMHIEVLSPHDLDFQPIEKKIPPIPKLSHGLDRVLFNPGVYRLQDPRSRVYNFDPYLEKIMPVAEFDFDALTAYKTSSKDKDLLAITREAGTKFTGSTSSMSSVLQHFHFVLSDFRELNHGMFTRSFPMKANKFTKVTHCPSAIFLRWKNGVYAIDADKSYDSPNIMSWLGHSMEKLLTTAPSEFERYRRSSPEAAPSEDDSGKCFHYSKQGNVLMRSQLDAHDSRLPGTGVFDLKTRAVVAIRMDHTEYETGSGYQIRYDHGEWESYEREFYDMTRATLLKYSMQVRMGRMDGIFVAYHNIERIFGFQYLSLSDMDNILHGQHDTCLGDQEFKLSISLLDELLQRATEKFPETTIRMHFEARQDVVPYMYVFAEPVTDEEADEIQNKKGKAMKEFEREVIGVKRDDPEIQAEWKDIQQRVDEEVVNDEMEARDEGVIETATIVRNDEEIMDAARDARDDKVVADPETTASDDQQVVTDELKAVYGEEAAGKETEGPSEETEPHDPVEGEEKGSDQVDAESSTSSPTKELMGWTLTVRNRVNGAYVSRPEKLNSSDDWAVEYHIKELDEKARRELYRAVKKRRKDLIGQEEEERARDLASYRARIKTYSIAGRQWREEQDKIDAEVGQQVYRPLGPGSEEFVQRESSSG